MKRYRMSICDIGCGPGLFSDEEPDGEWVHAEDAEAELARLRSALVEACDLALQRTFGEPEERRIAELRALASKEP